MKKLICIVTGVFLLGMIVAPATAFEVKDLIPAKWWPSEWGPDDEKGSFNTITPATILSAMKLVKEGKVYRLGMPYGPDMPMFGKRTFALHIPGLPVGGPFGKNGIVWNDEFLVCEVGQVGTQFDGGGHVGMLGEDGKMRWYNGAELATSESTYGLWRNGVEKIGPCIARGLLVDVAALKGVDIMDKGTVITPEDIEAALKKEGVGPIKEGDCLMFRTGWIKHWTDAATFNSGCPGIGTAAAKWLIPKKVSLLCSDTWPVEAIPGEDPDLPFIVHCMLQPPHGIWFLENLTFEEMSKDKVYESLFIFLPVPFVGATGSPGDAVAIK